MNESQTVYLLVPAGRGVLAVCPTRDDAWQVAAHCDVEYQIVAAPLTAARADGAWWYRATWCPLEGAKAWPLWPQAMGHVPDLVWPPTLTPDGEKIEGVLLAESEGVARELIAMEGWALLRTTERWPPKPLESDHAE